MKDGFVQCPKCNGKGINQYQVYDNNQILKNILDLKNGKSKEYLKFSSYIIKIKCEQCQATGRVDWASRPMGYKTDPFSLLEGNLDIYFHETHDYYWDLERDGRSKEPLDDRDQYRDLGKLIKNAQKRYTGISIDEKILSMDSGQLKEIIDRLERCNFKEEPVSEVNIKTRLKQAGLSNFIPDQFAAPEESEIIYRYPAAI